MIFPLVALKVAKKPFFDISIAQIVYVISIIWVFLIQKLAHRFDIISVLSLKKTECWKTHRYHSICDIA
jgi:hypothetical protein